MQQYDMAWLVKQIVLDKGGNTNSVINSISCIGIVHNYLVIFFVYGSCLRSLWVVENYFCLLTYLHWRRGLK